MNRVQTQTNMWKTRFPTLTWWNPDHQSEKLHSTEEFLKSWRQLKTLSSTGDHWDCNTIRSLAQGPKWITICFMQIEKGIVQNYREDCWICHWNSLGKKQFFLAIAETVLAGTRGVHWTPLMSILLGLGRSFSLIKPPVFQKVSGTKKNDLIWIRGTSFMREQSHKRSWVDGSSPRRQILPMREAAKLSWRPTAAAKMPRSYILMETFHQGLQIKATVHPKN